ncbi:MAG: hypothetical protein HY608_10005 [Planctomycetes bacterium]|nr:hypothetical protein [Planctomycetota bacterium]
MRRGLVALVLPLAVFGASTAPACPGCSKAVEAEGKASGSNLSRGYAWSIYLMMSAPFVITGAFGGAMYRSYRKSRRQESGDGSQEGGGPTPRV